MHELGCPVCQVDTECLKLSLILENSNVNEEKKGNIYKTIREKFKISFPGSGENLVWVEQTGRRKQLLKLHTSGLSTRFVQQDIRFRENTRGWSPESSF